jgi:hypothetical protein
MTRQDEVKESERDFKALAVVHAVHSAACTGKLEVSCADPQTMALWLGAMQMLEEFMGDSPASKLAAPLTDDCTRCQAPREAWHDDRDTEDPDESYCGLCGALHCDKRTVSDGRRCQLWSGHQEAGIETHRIGEWSAAPLEGTRTREGGYEEEEDRPCPLCEGKGCEYCAPQPETGGTETRCSQMIGAQMCAYPEIHPIHHGQSLKFRDEQGRRVTRVSHKFIPAPETGEPSTLCQDVARLRAIPAAWKQRPDPLADLQAIHEGRLHDVEPETGGTEPLCGEFVTHMIAGASWFPCGDKKGHEGGHRGAGNCFKHGVYLGEVGAVPQCPQWPNCAQFNSSSAPTEAELPRKLTAEETRLFESRGLEATAIMYLNALHREVAALQQIAHLNQRIDGFKEMQEADQKEIRTLNEECEAEENKVAQMKEQLTAIRALVEKGIPPLTVKCTDYGLPGEYHRAARDQRERQYTELLSQIGFILGEK